MSKKLGKIFLFVLILAFIIQCVSFVPSMVNADETWTAVDDSSADVTLSGSAWFTHNDWHETWQQGDYAQFTFTGTGIRWYSFCDTYYGRADVYIDGVFQQMVDLATFSPGINKVYEKVGLSSGSHTIKVVCKGEGQSNVYVAVIKFEYSSGSGPTPTPTPTPGGSLTKVSGTKFGTSPAYNNSEWTYDKATDGNAGTYFDYSAANGGYTGIDLGLGNEKQITKVRFYPRAGYAGRMTGGKFQGSNTSSSSGYTDLYIIPSSPSDEWNEATITDSASYRYLRYLSPNNGYCNIGEMEFYTGSDITPTPTPGGTTYYRIKNKWMSTQYLYDGGTRVFYSTGSDDRYLWSLENTGGYKMIKNKATGEYINIKNGADNVECTAISSGDTTSHWTVDVIANPWKSIKSRSNNNYINVERQLGYPTCDLSNVPSSDSWWSEQWEFVYVSGPTPPPDYPSNKVSVVSPSYCSNISGDTWIQFYAPGMTSATVKCWQSGGTYGSNSTVGSVTLDSSGYGSVLFPANNYPHGPLNIKITASGSKEDVCSLQVYNTGGNVWNQGLPASPPPQAAGMSLVYSDDFNSMPSISSTGSGATYAAHKPGGGDFSTIPFADPTGAGNPFSQVDSYLRIRANANTNTAGLISSLRADGTGFYTNIPCYFECRFIAQNATGTWPAFWLMTRGVYQGLSYPADEYDVIEAYGIEDPNHSNYKGYWINNPVWNQTGTFPSVYQNISQTTRGGGGMWHETFHTYGVKITSAETIYYMDNVELARYATTPLTKTQPVFFFINMATGGGWPVDLSRYGGIADMYIDWVRVYN